MDIRIIKTVHIRGVPRHEGDVVDVTSAEARQYISSGHAEELNYEKKEIKNKAVKKTKKKSK
jgi:hypothetical protein